MFRLKRKKCRFEAKVFCCAFVLLCAVTFSGITQAAEYNSAGRRDPFVPIVGGHSVGGWETGGIGEIISVGDIEIQGIVSGLNGKRSVIVNGEIMTEGEQISQLKIEKIGNNKVEIVFEGEKHTLYLYE